MNFNYLGLRIPDPRKFISLANIMAATDAIDRRWRIGVDWCRGYPDRLYSLKAKLRAQRRLNRSSNVRRRKRAAELARRRG